MLNKISRIAIPILALIAAERAHGAEAIGTLGCVICLAGGGGPLCVVPCAVAIATIPIPAF